MMESDDYVPQFSQMGEDPSSMAFTDFAPDAYMPPGPGIAPMGVMGGPSSMIPPHHQQQHAAVQQQLYYQQHNPLVQHQQMSGRFMPGPQHPEPPCSANPPQNPAGNREGGVGSIFDPVFVGTTPAPPAKGPGKGGGGKKKGGAAGTKMTKKQQQQQQQFQQQQASQPNYATQIPQIPQQQFGGGPAMPGSRMQLMSPQQQNVHSGYGYSTYVQQQQPQGYMSAGSAGAPQSQQQQQLQSTSAYSAHFGSPQQQHPYPVPFHPGGHRPSLAPPGQAQLQPAGYTSVPGPRQVPPAGGGYSAMKQMTPGMQSSQDIAQQQQLQHGSFQAASLYGDQQQGGNRPSYMQQQSGSTYSAIYQQQQAQQQSYSGFGPSPSSYNMRMSAPVAPSQQQPAPPQQQQQFLVQSQQPQSGGYPMRPTYPQDQPQSGAYGVGSGSNTTGYQGETASSNVDAAGCGTLPHQQSMYYRQATGGAGAHMTRPVSSAGIIRPNSWSMASEPTGPRMMPPGGVPGQQLAPGYPSQVYGQPQGQPSMYGRVGPNASQPVVGQPPSTVSSINHLQSVLEYSLPDARAPDGKGGQPATRSVYQGAGQMASTTFAGAPTSQHYTPQKPNSSPPPPTPRPKTPVSMSTMHPGGIYTASSSSGVLSPSAIQQISPAGSGALAPVGGGHGVPSASGASGGPTTSLSVVMPSDHRGPAVQLNIQPNSQPTTLITLYQLPPGSQPLPHAGMLQSSQQQSQASIPVPPEPTPSKCYVTTGDMMSPGPMGGSRNIITGPQYLDSPASMGNVGAPYNSYSQDTISATPGGKGKKKSKGKPIAPDLSTPVGTPVPPKKSSAWKRKRTAPTPAILPEDDADGATAAAVAAIAAVAAQPLPPKQRKKDAKKGAGNVQQLQEESTTPVPQPVGVPSELERILASVTPSYCPTAVGSVPVGYELPPPPPTEPVLLPFGPHPQQEHQEVETIEEDSKEQLLLEERNAPSTAAVDSANNTVDYSGSESQSEFSASLASNGSCVAPAAAVGEALESLADEFKTAKTCEDLSIASEDHPVADLAMADAEMASEEGPVLQTQMDETNQSELLGEHSHTSSQCLAVRPDGNCSSAVSFSNTFGLETCQGSGGASSEFGTSGKMEEKHLELQAENGSEDGFLSMAATTAMTEGTLSSTPKRKSKKNVKEDCAEATSSPSISKQRAKKAKEPKEPKPKKTPITSKYAGGKRSSKKKRRSATVFYSDESEEEGQHSAPDNRKSQKKQFAKGSAGRKATTSKKVKQGSATPAQLAKLERRTTSSSDLTSNAMDAHATGDALEGVPSTGLVGNESFGSGDLGGGVNNVEEMNLAAFAETRRSSRITKRKQYVDDWDYGISGSDEDRKSPSPDQPGKSRAERGDKGGRSELGQGTEKSAPPVCDPKDPAAAYFFLENPPAEDSHIVEKVLGCRMRKISPEKQTHTEEGTSSETAKEVDEFFVKYKNFSYLHCEWRTIEDLEIGDKRVHQKIKRFRQKHRQALFLDEFDEDEPFSPDYITVDRVLDVSTSLAIVEEESGPPQAETSGTSGEKDGVQAMEQGEEGKESEQKIASESVEDETSKSDEAQTGEAEQPGDNGCVKTSDACDDSQPNDVIATAIAKKESGERGSPKYKTVTHYLVKWRSLPYEEATWELDTHVDPVKIKEFYARRQAPADVKDKPRPRADDWKKVPDHTTYKNGNKLRDYQMEGISWLLFCWHNRQNCILADEMGLGKTIQTITFLVEVQKCGIRGPFLIIAPLSTIMNWQREFETWSDMNAIVYHGTSASRRMIQEYEMYYKNDAGDRVTNLFKFNALITTYEMVLTDCELLKDIPWRVCVIDEAHRLKNRNCKLLTGLATYRMEHRVLLTGTPLQNNIEELFSLLNFLEPRQFSNSQLFLAEFGQLQTDDQVQKLQEILKPMMLRRLKEDVEKSLKPKEETIIEVELTNIQKKYYRAILERNFSYLCKSANVPSLMNTMMELRKCCNHPFLITGAEEAILNEYRAQHPNTDEEDLYLNATIQSSGKLVLIDKLLPRLRASGHKVLVFSQMVKCLDILEDYLLHRKYPYERIDGNVRGDLRQSAIDRFCRLECDRFVFLLCTRAGGLGINLTAADTVIIFDSDWNPQNDLQAQARCHRIGQEKFVKVYRLITRQSYEREMFDKASVKLGLDKAVLQSMGPNKENSNAQLSKKEIEELLRKGAYGAIMDENNEGDRFCEEDIDQILQRRTQTITIQPGVKGSSFAKASFAVSSNRSDIDVNDPNFWQKWARKANVDPDFNPEKDLILYEPRQRKRRFADQYDEQGKGEGGNSDEDSDNNEKGDGSDSDSASDSRKIRAKNRNRKRARAMAERRDHDGDDSDYPDELAFTKSDYFKVEKYLSIFGWGRWKEILKQCSFKQNISESDVKAMCRTVLLHCLRQYHGDEKIKEFIWQLITPSEEGGKTMDDMKNHQGLFGPVPRGRKGTGGRQGSKSELMDIYHQGWAALPTYNPPVLAVDYGYERHLQRHANKVLLRVRLLYYLEHEIIGMEREKILNGADAKDLNLPLPWHPEVPVPWWDQEADKSLLVGIFKHGFENFDAMRMDPMIVFLNRCGPLTGQANSASKAAGNDDDLAAEREANEEMEETGNEVSKMDLDPAETAGHDDGPVEESDDAKQVKAESAIADVCPGAPIVESTAAESDYLPFPSVADLNGRFRRLITLCQRSSKISYIKEEQKAKKMARQEQMQAVLQERELRKLEERQRWSRREESDFYRALVNFGVEHNPNSGEYAWDRFKHLARLEAKYDHTLTDHYAAFMAMCKRVCKKPLAEEEQRLSFIPEALSEERANKVLQRVELMARVRQALASLRNDEQGVDEKMKLCKRTPDFPHWWETGRHDLELLRGIAKHGLNRSEEYVVQDPEFSFHGIWKCYQRETLNQTSTRAVTRTLAKISGNQKDDQDESKQEDEGEMDSLETTAASGDTEAAISQLVAQQTGSAMQWPKERAIIFRLQNICHLIEKGEWPTPRAYTLLDAAGYDQGSSTPDTPAAETPGPCDLDAGSFGAGLGASSSTSSRKDQQASQQLAAAAATFGSAFGLPLTASGTLKLDTFNDLAAAAAAAAFPLAGASGVVGIGRQQAGSSRGQSQRGGGRGRKRRHPMQDLMENERERMRALMHQSFLQQLEQFSFAGGLSLPLASSVSSPPLTAPSSTTSRSKAQSPACSAAQNEEQQVLNLSTKAKKAENHSNKDSSFTAHDHTNDAIKPLPFNDLAAMASLPPDTRVPVINIRDGSRLTGPDAPTLRNLAAWLSENPNYIIDMPPPTSAIMGALAAATTPALGASSVGALADVELEPGEIVRTSGRNRSPPSSSGVDPGQQHVTVWNRKNGLKLSGSKGPTLGNLAMWLEKNPEWDVLDIAKNMKSPEKGKSSHESQSSSKRSSSHQHRGSASASSSTGTTTTAVATSASSSSGMSTAAAQSALGANADLTSLLAATMTGMDPFQMSLLFPYGGANPAMLGLAPPGSTPGPFGAINPLSLFSGFPGAMPDCSPPPVLQPQQSSAASAKKESRGSSKSASDTQKSKSQSQAQQQQQQQDAANASAMAAAMNPFLLPGMANAAAAAAGIFGLNPFLAGAGGVMPGLAFPPTNMAAMAQLQALMGLQGMDSLMGINTNEAAAVSISGASKQTGSSAVSLQYQMASSGNPSTSSKPSVSAGSGTKSSTVHSSRSSVAGGQGKLNALVNKLVAAETKKRQQRSDESTNPHGETEDKPSKAKDQQ